MEDGRFSDLKRFSRICIRAMFLLAIASRNVKVPVPMMAFVLSYRCGAVPDLDRILF